MRSAILALALLCGFIGFVASAAEERIAWRQSGNPDGRALVLIPGLMSDGAVFDGVLADFSATARIEQATLAGFAGVPAPSDSAAVIDPAAEAAVAHMRQSGIRDAILVGHSIGGQIVLKMAKLAPDLVSSVIVIDSLPYLAAFGRPQIAPTDAQAAADALAAQLAALPDSVFASIQEQSVRTMTRNEAGQRTILGWTLASDRKVASTAIREAFGSDWRAEMASIAVPVTVLAAHDSAMPVTRDQIMDINDAQYAGLRNRKIVIVDDSFHFIMFDRPDAVIAALAERLEIRP